MQANLQGLLPALHIQDAATQAKITAVVGIVLSEVQSLAAIVPLVNPKCIDQDDGYRRRCKRRSGFHYRRASL